MSIDTNQPGFISRTRLNEDAARFYADQGYLVIPDALVAEEVEALKREALAVCRGQRGELEMSFPSSEAEAAFPGREVLASMLDEEAMAQFLCIHHPHKISSVMGEYLAHPVIVEVLTRVIAPNVKCMQSMLFIKSSGKPGQAWHQDEDFIPTRDRSLTGAWIALDDAVVENGCLWIIPGSHRPGILWPMYPHRDHRYDCVDMAYDFPYADEDAVPVEVPAGAIVFFNGYTLHKSEPNVCKQGFRRVLVNHYMSAQSLLPWFGEGNLVGGVAKADYRDIVMIAGTDPYAWKDAEEISRPHIRPAGEGGCGDGRVTLEEFKMNLPGQRV